MDWLENQFAILGGIPFQNRIALALAMLVVGLIVASWMELADEKHRDLAGHLAFAVSIPVPPSTRIKDFGGRERNHVALRYELPLPQGATPLQRPQLPPLGSLFILS